MNKLSRSLVSLSLVLCGLVSWAQSTVVPFEQIARDEQRLANLQVPRDEREASRFIEPNPVSSAGSGFVFSQPTYNKPRVLDSKFFLLNGLHLGLAALDIGLTQNCIAAHHCREGNPLMPSSLAGQLGLNAALIGSSGFISYRLKKQESNLWWLSSVAGIGAHTAGAVTGFVYR